MGPCRRQKKIPPAVFRKPQKNTKVAALQETIRLTAKEVREPIKTGKPGPSKLNKIVPPEETVVEPVRKNPYAREIFFCKTNIREIARQEVIEQRK